ncbi:MAG: hypothetical protein JEZ08_25530 [Clostridiales bacterium]|nr:hypothetical protein [Clostridiales bacterium]
MKKKNIAGITIVILSIALAIFYYLYKYNIDYTSNKSVKQDILRNELLSFLQVQSQLGGMKYETSCLQSVNDSSAKKCFTDQTHHIILWIPEDACSACFMGRLKQLRELTNKNPKAIPKFIFAGYKKNRRLLSMIAEMNIPIRNTFFVQRDEINEQLIQKVPILFVLDSKLSIIKHPFVSSKNISKQVYQGYLNHVAKLYFE